MKPSDALQSTYGNGHIAETRVVWLYGKTSGGWCAACAVGRMLIATYGIEETNDLIHEGKTIRSLFNEAFPEMQGKKIPYPERVKQNNRSLYYQSEQEVWIVASDLYSIFQWSLEEVEAYLRSQRC